MLAGFNGLVSTLVEGQRFAPLSAEGRARQEARRISSILAAEGRRQEQLALVANHVPVAPATPPRTVAGGIVWDLIQARKAVGPAPAPAHLPTIRREETGRKLRALHAMAQERHERDAFSRAWAFALAEERGE